MVNSKKIKKDKKKKEWSNVDKIKECEKIKQNIIDLGLNENFEEINYFYNILNNYLNDNISLSGKIKIYSIKKNLIYQLPLSKNNNFIVKLESFTS